jgi:hypothetical protein
VDPGIGVDGAISAAERMRQMRARRKAAGLRPLVSWVGA